MFKEFLLEGTKGSGMSLDVRLGFRNHPFRILHLSKLATGLCEGSVWSVLRPYWSISVGGIGEILSGFPQTFLFH